MIYTAIYQNSQGGLFTSRYTGIVNKPDAWLSAAKMGASQGSCLVALVPGDHPVYFYENFVNDTDSRDRTGQQDHDLYLVTDD